MCWLVLIMAIRWSAGAGTGARGPSRGGSRPGAGEHHVNVYFLAGGPPGSPAAGTGSLTRLAASFRPAGLTVAVTTEGEPRLLSPGANLTAFRIIQEALTHASQHVAASQARVRLSATG